MKYKGNKSQQTTFVTLTMKLFYIKNTGNTQNFNSKYCNTVKEMFQLRMK